MSKKWTINKQDIKKIIKNALIFVSPVVLVYLGSVLVNIKVDGFQLKDFNPSVEAVTAIMLWSINTLIDIFRKLQAGK